MPSQHPRSCALGALLTASFALSVLATAADGISGSMAAQPDDAMDLVQSQLTHAGPHKKHSAKKPDPALTRHKKSHKEHVTKKTKKSKHKRIVIRDDVDASEYVSDPTNYPFVFPLDIYTYNTSVGECAATLIDATHAITAAHCLPHEGKPGNIPVKIAGQSFNVVGAFPHPCFDYKTESPDGADVAVLLLDIPVRGVDPIPVYRWDDEASKQFELVGWGETGKAGDSSKDTTFDENFRVAENVVTKTANGMVLYDFDQGANALPHEGVAWSGDSGGPAFIKRDGVRYIAGVSSAGDCCQYGNQDGYAQLSDKLEWIEATVNFNLQQDASCRGLGDAPEK